MNFNDDKILITYIKSSPIPGSVDILTINSLNEAIIHEFCFDIPSGDVPTFFKFIPAFIKREVKAVILQLSEFQHPEFTNNIQLRIMISKEYEKHGIKYCFIDSVSFLLTQILVAANLDLKMGESLLIATAGEDIVVGYDLTKSENGYQRPLLKRSRIVKCPPGYNPSTVKDDILASSNPKRIILASALPNSSSLMKELRNKILKSKKLIAFENVEENYKCQTLIQIANKIFDRSFYKFFIIPTCYDSIFVENEKVVGEIGSNIKLGWGCKDTVPGTEIFIAPRSYKPYYIGYIDGEDCGILTTLPVLDGQYHKVKLTLTMDENLIPRLSQEAYIDPRIEELPMILTKKMDSKIPVIGFFDNSSVICIFDESENCYKFSENWNGLFGKDLFIAFDEEKPTFFDEAIKVLETHPTSVVYDILYIMGCLKRSVHRHPDWQFKITFDDNHELLIEFDNFDGNKTVATPEFFMALFLKEHLKAIKKEIGEKPKKLGFVFFDKTNQDKIFYWTTFETNFMESCNLLKIEYCLIDSETL